MQHITTKFLGATSYRGARIKATHSGKAVENVNPYEYAVDGFDNHRNAAVALARKLGWTPCDLVHSGTDTGYIWVLLAKHNVTQIP
jgi:hypothetical protein